MDKFNLRGYLKNNRLLNESIGGYVDLKPMKEELGTAMEDIDENLGTASSFNEPFYGYGEDDPEDYTGPSVDGAISQRHLNQLENTVAIIIEDLSRLGFDIDDVKAYLVNYIKNM